MHLTSTHSDWYTLLSYFQMLYRKPHFFPTTNNNRNFSPGQQETGHPDFPPLAIPSYALQLWSFSWPTADRIHPEGWQYNYVNANCVTSCKCLVGRCGGVRKVQCSKRKIPLGNTERQKHLINDSLIKDSWKRRILSWPLSLSHSFYLTLFR